MPGPVVVDIQGHRLQPQERARLRHPLVGGVILFARNFRDRHQLRALCDEIHAVREPGLLIAVDQEGGRVQRFRDDGFTILPPMADLGRCWDADPDRAQALAHDVGRVLAAELRACGVDLSFTPVLDLDWGHSAVIGNRALHAQADVVSALARALIGGLAQAGMAACGKHFPGHGWATADSHHAIAVDDRPLAQILAQDAAPYGALDAAVLPAIMPAHVVYPQVDARPAGFSPVWIQTVLRTRLGYDGLVFSDDLTMQAAQVAGDVPARALAALQAGCDMVLVCNRPDLADAVLACDAVAQHPLEARRLQRLRPSTPAPDWAALQHEEWYRDARARLRSETFPG